MQLFLCFVNFKKIRVGGEGGGLGVAVPLIMSWLRLCKERYEDLLSFLLLALGAGEAEGGAGEAEGDPRTVSVFICNSHWQYTG